jgi:peptide/nickel transport system permease protein
VPWRYLFRRIGQAIPVLIGVSLVTFGLLHVTGGSAIPGLDVHDPRFTVAEVEALRHAYGLDQPLVVQYLTWLSDLIHGDLGRSMLDGTPVTIHILERLPNTLELMLTAMAIGLLIAVPIGVISAIKRGTVTDNALSTLSAAGVAVPTFWLGLMLIYFFAVLPAQRWGSPLLPSSGAVSAFGGGDLLDRILHLLLPATVVSFGYIVVWSRYVRSSMLDVLSQDYVRTARAKGMTERRVVYIHALRNAIVPLITLIGLELPALLSGSVVVEVIFGWPGIGRFAYERALSYDYTAVMGVTMFGAALIVLGNLIADLLYTVADPRIRY